MTQAEAHSAVEKWWKESLEHSSQSNDALLTLLSKGFESIAIALSQKSSNDRITRAIASLDYERSLALQFESTEFDVLRHLSFGLVHSIQFLLEWKGKKSIDADLDMLLPRTVKEEPIDNIEVILDGEEIEIGNEKITENTLVTSATDVLEGNSLNKSLTNETTAGEVQSEFNSELAMNNVDDDTEPPFKKVKNEVQQKNDNVRAYNKEEFSLKLSGEKSDSNLNFLECPECQFRTRSIRGWMSHLSDRHFTTPREMGLAILCECGHEGHSENHLRRVHKGYNCTVIRKAATSPKCPMCKAYPPTPSSYTAHLQNRHATTLAEMGIFVKCPCGNEIRNNTDLCDCKSYKFTLHKAAEE